jgi:hypothetical protein
MVNVLKQPQVEQYLKNYTLNSMWTAVSCSFDLTERQLNYFADILRGRTKMFGPNYLVTPNYFLSQRSYKEYLKLNMYVEITLKVSHYRRVHNLWRKRKRDFSVLGQTRFHRFIKQTKNILQQFRKRR